MFLDPLPHAGRLFFPTTSTDASGAPVIAYSGRTGNIPCLIRGMPGDEQQRFAQRGIVVTHDIATLSSDAQSGDKFVDDQGNSYILKSIRRQQAVGNIDEWYLWLGEQLL